MSTILTFAVFASVTALLIEYGFQLRTRWRLRHIVQVPGHFLLGNLLAIRRHSVHEAFQRWAQLYGGIYVAFFGRRPQVVVSDPELVRDIAMRHFRCFHDRQRPVRPEALPGDKTLATLYSGMLWTRGELWNSTRGSLKHLFSTGALHSYVPCMNASAEEFLQSIQRSYEAGSAKQSGERAEDEKRRADAPYAAISTPSSPSKYKPLDIHELAGRATMQIVFRAMFGVNIDTSRDGRADRLNSVPNLLEAARVMLESVTVWPQQAAMGLLYTVPRWAEGIVLRLLARAAPGQASADYARTSLNSTTGLLVESARRGAEREGEDVRLRTTDWKWWGPGWETRNLHRHASPHAGSLPRRLALTELRGQGCGLTDAQAASHCSTFISAGYETTANAVAFAVHLLSKHPQHEARLLAEIDQAVGKAEPDAHHLPHCPFVEAVINETLRIYPPAHAVIRECTQTCEIGNGILIPKGTEMHLAIYTMHHDPRLWHKPEAFRPERFLPGEEADTRHPNAFMPFGIGPRMCIGWRFAMQELMLILIRLYQHYTFELIPAQKCAPLKIRQRLTLSPLDGVWVTPVPRNTEAVHEDFAKTNAL